MTIPNSDWRHARRFRRWSGWLVLPLVAALLFYQQATVEPGSAGLIASRSVSVVLAPMKLAVVKPVLPDWRASHPAAVDPGQGAPPAQRHLVCAQCPGPVLLLPQMRSWSAFKARAPPDRQVPIAI